ncbi:hypothetical protein [Pedobacter frigiditerrae]|uniref:tellurite resistance TerB family protein n=1 Tax=Pedobacter frigiditerrae TaxID=2530452 RepID=UPI00292FE1F6|nr:hypothetical protein [Pedobacter frigiditerrae]
MEFTYIEKKAMVCMLMVLAIQDGKIDDNEIEVVKDSLNVDNDLLIASGKVKLLDAIDTINLMHITQKMKFAMIVLDVAKADGFMHPKETLMTKQYFDLLGITEFLDASKSYNDSIRRAGKIDWNK